MPQTHLYFPFPLMFRLCFVCHRHTFIFHFPSYFGCVLYATDTPLFSLSRHILVVFCMLQTHPYFPFPVMFWLCFVCHRHTLIFHFPSYFGCVLYATDTPLFSISPYNLVVFCMPQTHPYFPFPLIIWWCFVCHRHTLIFHFPSCFGCVLYATDTPLFSISRHVLVVFCMPQTHPYFPFPFIFWLCFVCHRHTLIFHFPL